MNAKDPEQYRAAWQAHISNLASLALAAGIQYDEYIAAKKRLEEWLDQAVTKFEQRNNHE